MAQFQPTSCCHQHVGTPYEPGRSLAVEWCYVCCYDKMASTHTKRDEAEVTTQGPACEQSRAPGLLPHGRMVCAVVMDTMTHPECGLSLAAAVMMKRAKTHTETSALLGTLAAQLLSHGRPWMVNGDYDLMHMESPTELKHITQWRKLKQPRLLQ